MSEGVKVINDKLIEYYGNDPIYSKPYYRIVWSTSQREKRKGTFKVETESGIYLRTETCVKDVEKYPFFEDMWVLEILMFNVSNPELVEKFSYEPLWIFGSGNSERQPIWRAVKLLITAKLYLQTAQNRLTLTDFQDIEDKRMIAETALFKQMLQNESPYIAGALHDGAAVTVGSNNLAPLSVEKE